MIIQLQHREPAYKNQEFLQYAPQEHQQITQAAHAQFTEQQQRDSQHQVRSHSQMGPEDGAVK